jgi:biopolymer transport protein ExbD
MRYGGQNNHVHFNMTPMIDVVFLLIIFFILVSTFASAENVRMDLPKPEKSQAKNVKIVDRVVVNCQLTPRRTGQAAEGVQYRVGPNPPEPLPGIADRLAAYCSANPKLKVIIRADKNLRYEQVREVMEIVAETGVEDMSLVAHVGVAEE